MKRISIILIMFFLLISLSNCLTFKRIKPEKCNPEVNVTEEQVRKDLEDNKQEYLDMINLLDNSQIQITHITFDDSLDIIISAFTGSREDFLAGRLDFKNQFTSRLENLDDLSQEDKNFIKNFIENRNSREFEITYKAWGDGKIYFYFFGLTYIIYKDDEFEILTRGCPY